MLHFRGVNVQDFTEMFDQERENNKSTKEFYTFSRITVKFQWFDVPVEGLPLLEKMLSNFMSRCTYGNAVRKVMFKSLVAVLLDIERTPLKNFNLHKVPEWKDVLSELQSMRFDVGFILDWLKTTAASCIIRDGEMKLAELTAKIAGLEKEIATKVSELSLLTSQKESIMLSLAISGNSSSVKTLGGLLDYAIHALVYICIFFYSHCISGQLHLGCNMCFETSLVIKTSFPFSFYNRRRKNIF